MNFSRTSKHLNYENNLSFHHLFSEKMSVYINALNLKSYNNIHKCRIRIFLWMRQKEKDLFSFERKNIMINLELLTRWLQETSILNVWHFFVRGKYV